MLYFDNCDCIKLIINKCDGSCSTKNGIVCDLSQLL